ALSACEGFQPPSAPTIVVNPAASTLPARLVLMVSSRPDHRLNVRAEVLSADGHSVANVAVRFAIGAGTMTPQAATTDSAGVAHAVAVSTAMTDISATIAGVTASVFVLPSQ